MGTLEDFVQKKIQEQIDKEQEASEQEEKHRLALRAQFISILESEFKDKDFRLALNFTYVQSPFFGSMYAEFSYKRKAFRLTLEDRGANPGFGYSIWKLRSSEFVLSSGAFEYEFPRYVLEKRLLEVLMSEKMKTFVESVR